MRWSARMFTIRGIDVRVHATFLIIVGLSAWQWGTHAGSSGAAFGAVFTLLLFGCVLLHELGHSFVAQHYGLKVREVLLLPIGGIASLEGEPRTPRQEVAVALAGPAVNVVLAGLLFAGLWLTGQVPATWAEVAKLSAVPSGQTLLLLLISGNASLALFNLLPVFPLDGGRVLRALLQMRWGAVRATAWAAGLGQVVGLALAVYAVFSGQLLLGLIAVLVFMSAGQEGLRAQLHAPMTSLTAGDLAELPAADLDANWRVRDALPLLLRTGQPVFPVVQGERVLGVVARGELIAVASQAQGELLSVRALMQPALTLDASLPLQVALAQLHQSGAKVAIVMGQDHPMGLLSELQVLSKLAQAPRLQWPSSTAKRAAAASAQRSALES